MIVLPESYRFLSIGEIITNNDLLSAVTDTGIDVWATVPDHFIGQIFDSRLAIYPSHMIRKLPLQ